MAISFEFDGIQISTDKQGYLLDHMLWQEEIAKIMAVNDAFELTPEHWEVIDFVRQFYLTYNTSPAIRALTKAMKKEFGTLKQGTFGCKPIKDKIGILVAQLGTPDAPTQNKYS